MTIIKFAFLLLGMAVIIFIAGFICYFRSKSREDFRESVIFTRAMIDKAELTEQGYKDCLEAFREFNYINFRNEKEYKSLYTGFLFKYRDFLPEDEGIKIVAE
jgi:hypothetical protein